MPTYHHEPIQEASLDQMEFNHDLLPISYNKGILASWGALILTSVALLSYSDYAHKPSIATSLYRIVSLCVGARIFSFFSGILTSGKKEEEKIPEAMPLTSRDKNNVDIQQTKTSSPSRPRLHYLDNVKVFLTVLVVSHHVSCSFGGRGPRSWPLVIGMHSPEDSTEPPVFTKTIQVFTLLNQSYFMALFFFISAYFVPSSYIRKKKKVEFHYDKAKRYLLPLCLVVLVIMPITILIGLANAGSKLFYEPAKPGPAWFLFWLIIFNTIYATAATTRSNELPRSDNAVMKIPNVILRGGFGGLIICGLSMLLIKMALNKRGNFFYMPMEYGSLSCDIFFFTMGIIAYHNRWLDTPIRDQLDIPVWVLYLFVISEMLILVFLFQFKSSFLMSTMLLYLVAGLFCVDMSISVLIFFQTYADFKTPVTTYLSKAAYGVYIIHPVVVNVFTSVFVFLYNNTAGVDDGIQFKRSTSSSYVVSYSQLVGPDKGGLILFIGWLFCNVLSHAVCWPLSHWLKSLSGLKHIL